MKAALRDAKVASAIGRGHTKHRKKAETPIASRTHVVKSDAEYTAAIAKAKPGDRIVKEYEPYPGEVTTEVVRAPDVATRQVRREAEQPGRRYFAHATRAMPAKEAVRKARASATEPARKGAHCGTLPPRIKSPGKHRRQIRAAYRKLLRQGVRFVSLAAAQKRGTRTPDRRKAPT